MANLSTNNIAAQRQILAAIKAGMESLPNMGIIHDNEKKPPATAKEYRAKILKWVDASRANKEIMRGAFIAFQGPAAGDSGTVNRVVPELSYKVLIVWQFEDTETYNSCADFNDMMIRFYDYFETNHSLGLSGLNMYAPELITKASIQPFDEFYFHLVEFELTCSLFGS